MTNDEMKNSEICEKAIEILEERGWVQGSILTGTGSTCLVGAGVMAQAGDITRNRYTNMWPYELNHKTAQIIDTAVEFDVPYQEGGLPEYKIFYLNDHVIETQEEAIDVLMTAAKYWRDRGE